MVEGMSPAAIIPLALFGLVLTCVGIKLTLLWRKTRALPELLLGSGLLFLSLVAMPLCAIGRLPSLVGTPAGRWAFGGGMLCVALALSLVAVFNRLVFRPHARAARVAAGALQLGFLLAAAGAIHGDHQATTLSEILPHTRPFNIAVVGLAAALFGWGAGESWLCYIRGRRQLALGLTEVVTVNRFLLWGVGSTAALLLCSLLMVGIALGRTIAIDPLAQTLIACAGSLLTLAWWLTFFAPAFYRRWLEDRHAASTPA